MANDLDNAAIAQQLEAFAGLLDLSGSSYYTSRAYRRAAETIRESKAPIAKLVREGRVQDLRGIGPGIAGRVFDRFGDYRYAFFSATVFALIAFASLSFAKAPTRETAQV